MKKINHLNNNRCLATTKFVKLNPANNEKILKDRLFLYLSELVKYEDPVSLDYPPISDLDGWISSLKHVKDIMFYFFVSGNITAAGAYVAPPAFRRKIFYFNEKEEPEFKIICYPELTGVFVLPEFRGRGLVGDLISLSLEDYESIIILPKTRKDVEKEGFSILSSLVGKPVESLRVILNCGNERAEVEPLLLYDIPSDRLKEVRNLIGLVDDSSLPMKFSAMHRGNFIGYSFPWLGPVYLLSRNRESF
jgi:hypothetical protein